MRVDLQIGGTTRRVELNQTAGGWVAIVDGHTRYLNTAKIGEWSSLLVTGHADRSPDASRSPVVEASHEIAIEDCGNGTLIVHVDGIGVPVVAIDPRRAFGRGEEDRGRSGGPVSIAAPMPGRVVKVLVKPGDHVSARQGLVVVEAMKMENELRAPVDGRVVEVRAVDGASVEANTVLIVLE